MGIPLRAGSNPEIITVNADTWTKIFSGVNLAKITNLYNEIDILYLTYVKEGDPAPTDLLIPKWKVPAGYAAFNGANARYDIYAYPEKEDLEIRLEA